MQQQQRKISDEGLQVFKEHSENTFFKVTHEEMPINIVHLALNCFAPRALNVSNELYRSFLTMQELSLSYNDMQILMQILVQASGKAMGIEPEMYADYLTLLDSLGEKWGKVWNATIDDFETKYPFVAEQKETAEVISLNPKDRAIEVDAILSTLPTADA